MVYLKQIAILGSTGSIGTQALDVCRHLGYSVVAITANRDVDGIAAQAREFLPRYAVMYDKIAAARLREELAGTGITVLEGEEGLCQAASMPEAELVLNSLSGMVGLRPTLAALEATLMDWRDHRYSPALRRTADPGRQRTHSHLPVHTGRGTKQNKNNPAHCFGRSVLRKDPGRNRACGGCQGAGPSQVEHGAEDHSGFRHPHEQGPGIH